MSHPDNQRRDFFVSFNSADRQWAEWIAAELEGAGYTTFFQDWDFRPGSNFVLEMHKAAALSDRTIMVLSPAYLKALFTQPEWAAALVQDPTGSQRALVPVRVEECSPVGILKAVVRADLVGREESAARETLLAAVNKGRPKPKSVGFPPAKPQQRRTYPAARRSTNRPPPPDQQSPPPPAGQLGFRFGWFLLALVVALLMIAFADRLAGYGLVNHFYYLALVALGLAATGTLFGELRSRARYLGKSPWGVLELGGPVVAFVLVVGGGALFAPARGPFGLTVFLRGQNGEILVRNQGRVMLHLGPDARVESIGEKGTALFAGVPSEFRGQAVTVAVEAEGYEQADASPVKLGETVNLLVRRRASRLYGVVEDDTRHPIAGATVDAGGVKRVTGEDGRFELAVAEPQVLLRVRAKGFEPYTENVSPGGNEMTLQLSREGNPK